MRERLCLALMPLLGPYTRERPRRPKGGPDGGRDIEAIHEGSRVVWGAVGFKNGGGSDDNSRREIVSKFEADIDRALEENSTLEAFIFFTNVDLTPGNHGQLIALATSKGVSIVDIVDMERIRHLLDSPEGLIARLQYLGIPMSSTEQMALVNRFGTQLQHAVSARFDRVEQMLSSMERFLDMQKCLYRIDLYLELLSAESSAVIGKEGLLLKIDGIIDLGKSVYIYVSNQPEHKRAPNALVTQSHLWLDNSPNRVLSCRPFVSPGRSHIMSCFELNLSKAGNQVKMTDLSSLALSVFASEGFSVRLKRVLVDGNGYELFDCPTGVPRESELPQFPDSIHEGIPKTRWQQVVFDSQRELLFDPPKKSGRLVPLIRLED